MDELRGLRKGLSSLRFRALVNALDQAEERTKAQLGVSMALDKPVPTQWNQLRELKEFEQALQAAERMNVLDSLVQQARDEHQKRARSLAEELLKRAQASWGKAEGILSSPFARVVLKVHLSAVAATKLTKPALEEKAAKVELALSKFLAEKPSLIESSFEDIDLSVKIEYGNFFLPRSQDLPDNAFTDSDEAAKQLLSGRQRILVLSHGWRAEAQPDPDGKELYALRHWLKEKDPAWRADRSLFYDWASVPQVDSHTGVLEEESKRKFFSALDQMSKLYASLSGTQVLRLAPERMPDAGEHLQGVIWLALQDDDTTVLGSVLSRAIGVGHPVEHRYGRKVTIRFESHEAAESALQDAGVAWRADDTRWFKKPYAHHLARKKTVLPKAEDWAYMHGYGYNSTSYERRKWCVFESGVASATQALLSTRAAKQVADELDGNKLESIPFVLEGGEQLGSWPGVASDDASLDQILESTEKTMHEIIRAFASSADKEVDVSGESAKLLAQIRGFKNDADGSLREAEGLMRGPQAKRIEMLAGLRDEEKHNSGKNAYFNREAGFVSPPKLDKAASDKSACSAPSSTPRKERPQSGRSRRGKRSVPVSV